MILRDSNGDPAVFTVKVAGNQWFPDDEQLVQGNLVLLSAPKSQKKWSEDRHWEDYSEDPIGVVFVPWDDQEVKRS